MEIYANLALISGVNDSPGILLETARRLRQAQIDFHHVYVAGLPVQDRLNKENPIETRTIIDMASVLRKECTGREIPLYVIQTPLGEVDFNLTSRLMQNGSTVYACLDSYGQSYIRAMGDGPWIKKIKQEDKKILVPVKGLVLSRGRGLG